MIWHKISLKNKIQFSKICLPTSFHPTLGEQNKIQLYKPLSWNQLLFLSLPHKKADLHIY